MSGPSLFYFTPRKAPFWVFSPQASCCPRPPPPCGAGGHSPSQNKGLSRLWLCALHTPPTTRTQTPGRSQKRGAWGQRRTKCRPRLPAQENVGPAPLLVLGGVRSGDCSPQSQLRARQVCHRDAAVSGAPCTSLGLSSCPWPNTTPRRSPGVTPQGHTVGCRDSPRDSLRCTPVLTAHPALGPRREQLGTQHPSACSGCSGA